MAEEQDKIPKKKPRIILRIAGFVKPFVGLLLGSILLNTIFSALSTITISLIKPIFQILFGVEESAAEVPATFLASLKNQFYDFIYSMVRVEGDRIGTLVSFGILIIVVIVLKNTFKYWGSVVSVKLEEGIIKSIRDKIFDKLTSLSVDFFSKSREGTLISIVTNDVHVLNGTTISAFTIVLREFIQIVLYLFLLISISGRLTLIAFSTSIISLFLMRLAMRYLRRYASRMQSAMADYTTTLQETIAGIRVVKAYSAENDANNRFYNDSGKYVKSAVKHKKIITLVPAINEVFAIVALSVVLLVGGIEVFQGEMLPDDLMLFLFALFAIMSPVTTMVNNISQFQRGIVSAERIFKILDREPSVESGSVPVERFKEKLEVKDVNFAYEKENVLKDINICVEKGKKIAFVGPSGSGKSTALDLLIRFYDPKTGRIEMNGTDIRNFRLEQYRSLFGIVAQETMLFNDTVANNIRYGCKNVSREEIEEAAKIANAHNFINKLPDGFDTFIGDRGIILSGGERQRIAIARALIRNPEILVFDEATSALDAESEKVVQKAINDSLENRTAIIVAHRLATIIDCHEIIVFDHGRIVERGTHSELVANNGVYKMLYDIQFAREELGEDY
jgi:subfamily B ATP-binding cassette protein MsbA